MNNYIGAKLIAGDKVTIIETLKTFDKALPEVESLPLVITRKMKVVFSKKAFEIEKEGLYRFADFDKKKYRNLIFYKKDNFTFFASICRLHLHGRTHKKISKSEQKSELTKKGRLSITCGTVHSWAMMIMADLGMRVRRVELLTLDEWNNYDNGHVLMEYFYPKEKRWMAVDLDTRSLFVNKNGHYMNIFELTQTVKNNEAYRIKRICLTDGIDHADPFDTFCEEVHLLENGKKMWFQRIAQVPFICDLKIDRENRMKFTSYFPYKNLNHRKKIEEYQKHFKVEFNALPEKKWLKRFYGSEAEG